MRWQFLFPAAVLVAQTFLCAAAPATLTIQTDQPGAKINPAMWGVFFEDINFGADGGLYAELVKNRSFEFPNPLMGWQQIPFGNTNGSLEIRTDDPFHPANLHYLRVQSGGAGPFGAVNEGFRGMGVRAGENYDFTAQMRVVEGSPSLAVELVSATGKVLATARLENVSRKWEKISATLVPSATEVKARLQVIVAGPGKVDCDMVSLFPQKTWKNRPGGLRADMVQLLADLQPGFVRFPGGCIVEGHWLTNRYQWKTTIGPVAERKLILNRWNDEIKNRRTPDYFQSFGLGFFEYFQLCEDLGAEPLPILNCGMACQFNSGELIPLDQLDPYIQDALDLIEFANGPATSKWGAKRAAMGHPQPFNMKLLGVGNEQWGPQYIERFAAFDKALKAKHPNIQLIASAGPSPADERFKFLWPKLRELNVDIVDEHSYANPNWFLANANRYDHYDRTGPQVFMGEYAAHSTGNGTPESRNNLESAIAEAAFLTGLERNADVVRMASYAPLFAHADAWQWATDLIWCDNLRAYGTANYYVQQLFSRNRGDVVLPVKLEDPRPPAPAAGRIGLATYQTAAEFRDVRVTHGGEILFAGDFSQPTKSWTTSGGGKWSVRDGVYQQADARAITTSLYGDAAWSDYTLSLKARKLRGNEGFIIVVRHQGDGNQVQWNLGGWGNRQHGLQVLSSGQDEIQKRIPGRIETNRWYDIKIELKGDHLDCYLDGQLVQSADVPAPVWPRFFASAAREEKSGAVIVKVVNASGDPAELELNLAGLAAVASTARIVVLTGAAPGDANSFDEPRKIAPVEMKLEGVTPRLPHTFPAHSLTVMRFGVK